MVLAANRHCCFDRRSSILQPKPISQRGKAQSHASFPDCGSISCPTHCSNAQIRRGCGIVCHRVPDCRTSSTADRLPERLRAGSCLHSRYPRDRAILRSGNRSPLNRSPRVKRHKDAVRPGIVEWRHLSLAYRCTIRVFASIEPVDEKEHGFPAHISVTQADSII